MAAHQMSHTQQGTVHPGFHQTWADHRWGQQAAHGLGADRDHHASLPAADCITWTVMLPTGRYMLHLLHASFFPSVPPFCRPGEWTHLSDKPCLASLLLLRWGSSTEVLLTKKAPGGSQPVSSQGSARQSKGLKYHEGFLCEPWKGLRKRKLA